MSKEGQKTRSRYGEVGAAGSAWAPRTFNQRVLEIFFPSIPLWIFVLPHERSSRRSFPIGLGGSDPIAECVTTYAMCAQAKTHHKVFCNLSTTFSFFRAS
jgi:hypothetical protein